MTVSMKKVAMLNIDIKVWTRKSDFPQGNLLRSLTQHEITGQRSFKRTGIEYDLIKDEM